MGDNYIIQILNILFYIKLLTINYYGIMLYFSWKISADY